MGVISNYTELKTAVQTYAKRSTTAFTENLPAFVLRAHVTLMRDLDIPLLQASSDLTINAERVNLPTDFRAVSRLSIDSDWDNPLSPTSIELRLRESVIYTSGRPRVFTIEASQVAFGPVPDTTYTGKLLYKRYLPFFTTDLSTNDLLARYPFAYLYGALAESYGFDKFDEDQAKYEALFRAEIDSINRAEQANSMAGGVLQPSASGSVV